MTRKEFKNKLKQENDISIALINISTITAGIALVIVLCTFIIVRGIVGQMIGYSIGIGIAIMAIIVDIIGEVNLGKKYKRLENKEK